MPELPEITRLARQINQNLVGKHILSMEIIQPKSLNLPEDEFRRAITGAMIRGAHNRGKWIFMDTSQGWLLLNLGMGGEVLLTPPDQLPAKRRLVFLLDSGQCLSLNFWWFGYVHYVAEGELSKHAMTARLGPNALEIDEPTFQGILRKNKGAVKSVLLDQAQVAGIGNAYVHDILFLGKVHPLKRIDTLSNAEISQLYQGMRTVLIDSLDKGTAFYEMDLFGNKGGYGMEDILVGYKEGQPCPVCGTAIEKIRTGSTSSFICPICQVR